jgi:putative DNA primase/helicase
MTTSSSKHRALKTVALSEVASTPVVYLYPGYLPVGAITVIAGPPGLGKSYVTLDWGSRVSAGLPWPCSSEKAPCGMVVILSDEDGAEDTIRPRVEAMGGNLSNILKLSVTGSGQDLLFDAKKDMKHLDELLGKHKPRLVIIDPLTNYLSGVDSNKETLVRPVLTQIATLARKHSCAVVVVLHFNKSEDRAAINRTSGAMAFTGVARAVYTVLEHPKDRAIPKDQRRRLLAAVKFNIDKPPTTLAFSIQGDKTLKWQHAADYPDADAILQQQERIEAGRDSSVDSSEVDQAEEFLRGLLADGEVNAKHVRDESRENGHSFAAIRRAKKRLGVLHVKGTGAKHAPWVWKLPGEADNHAVQFAQLAQPS